MSNNTDGYTNGVNHYPPTYRDAGSARIGREYRSGGYGGFEAADGNFAVPHDSDDAPSTSIDERSTGTDVGYGTARQAFSTRNQAGWQHAGRHAPRDGPRDLSTTYGHGQGGRQIEDVLRHINDKWDFMASEDCIPVHVALQLMDHSSLGRGRDYQDFQRTSRHLQKALRSIVNGTLRASQASSIQASQTRVRALKESVYSAKSNLMEAKPELQELGSSSQRYERMVQILGQMEKLQTVPELLDARIAEKHFLAAVDLLQDALRIIRKSEMESIGGLSDLRVYFSNQETMNEDMTSNLQADSFRYIHMLLEALDRLGCLEVAIDRIEQRLPVELFNIVDKTNHEVDLRHPAHLHDTGRLEFETLKHGSLFAKGRSGVLDDLLRTLYSKFGAVAEGHRVLHDVVSGIARRNGVRRPSDLTRSFKELWKLYQSERVFRLVEVDQKANNLTNEQEDLEKILQTSVPGLVSKSPRRSGPHSGKDRTSRGGPATHKLLAESSVFNIAILLPPSLSFLQRLKDIVPIDSDIAISTLTSFLDDFLVNVFLPQLEETVMELCEESYMRLDAFQEAPDWRNEAQKPILKSTSDFFALIKTFCRLLDSLPQDQSFIQPILAQLASYYDRCRGWYHSMVRQVSTTAQGKEALKSAAAMAETGQLRDLLNSHWASPDSDHGLLIQKETEYLISKTNISPMAPGDIISDRRTVPAMCLLYSSMQWLATGLDQIRLVVSESQSTERASTRPQHIRRWTVLELKKPHTDEEPIHLPLNQEAAATLEGIVQSMRALAIDALFTLQVDIRCGIAHMIAQMLQAPYSLEYPTNNPDPGVLSLNSDLLSFNDTVLTCLPPREHQFITDGLTTWMDALLVSGAARIVSMNANGCGRMQLNILVLQQNLKAIEGDISLSRSARFFELFAQGEDAVLAKARETRWKDMDFSLEELKALLELCHSESLQSPQRESSVQARKRLEEHLRQLEGNL
ncbi:MAG: hypothetical protein LQ341_000806 [Variospora aurantia]|nr:MAG: hypothetical protein LQ341_000806 [Variospora aurantia]